uniref:Uncharacterized protein n=1 Tax=Pipistrellus kuhlii TaxID=59472 RepID=A0A7J7SPE1_PIPKU|nr:hypothetical protein mPipKuh1_009781 [Pipistrellus kuhlii]
MGRLGLLGAEQEPSLWPKMPFRHLKLGPNGNKNHSVSQQKELNAGMAGLVAVKVEKSQMRDSEAARGQEAAAATTLGWRDRALAVLPDPRTRVTGSEGALGDSHCLRCPRHEGEGVGVVTKVGGKTGGDLNTPDSAALKTLGFSQGCSALSHHLGLLSASTP